MRLPKCYEDPEINEVHAEPVRAYYIPHALRDDALRLPREKSKRVLFLDGEWLFRLYPSPEKVPDALLQEGYEFGGWDSVQVPSNWQMQGYGELRYLNHRYPIPFDPPFVPYNNQAGVYSREFTMTGGGMRHYLVLEGVDSCAFIWLNGQFVGYTQISHSMTEFEITQKLREGKNRIIVLVLQYCDGTYLEDQDKIRMSGLFRSVYILSRPREHLRSFKVETSINIADSSAVISIKPECAGKPTIKAQLLSPNGDILSEKPLDGATYLSVEDALCWNAERPELYTLLLISADEVIAKRIGLREICRKEDTILLNGVKIKLKGVNRHDFSPVSGYAVTEADMRRDLELMKAYNLNAVRTSHYPNSPIFPELCDELGIYVMAEADIETHGLIDLISEKKGSMLNYLAELPLWKQSFLERNRRNVIRDQNSPSVIIWSLGNESGYGDNFASAAKWIREYDPTRLIHYTEASKAAGDCDLTNLDFYSTMYADPSMAENYLTGSYEFMARKGKPEIAPVQLRGLPLVQSEMSHAMGNSPGDIEDYYRLMYEHDNYVGNFIWEWCDHAVFGGFAENGRPIYRYGDDFGLLPNDGKFSVDGLFSPDRTPHPGALELKNAARPVRVCGIDLQRSAVTLRNTLDFTDMADACEVRVTGIGDGREIFRGAVRCAPHETVELKLNCEIDAYESLLLRYCKDGRELGFDQIILNRRCCRRRPCRGRRPAFLEIGDRIVISGDGFSYTYSKPLGVFESITVRGEELIPGGMGYNTWRAPIDNDKHILKEWKKVGYDRCGIREYSTKIEAEENEVVIRAALGLVSPGVQRILEIKAEFRIDGVGDVSANIFASRADKMPWLPRFGLRFFVPEGLENVNYHGFGPGESYVDKHLSCWLDTFHDTVECMHQGYIVPQENGSHFGTDMLCLADGRTELKIQSESPFSFSASHFTQEELTERMHDHELKRCGYTVLCIDASMSGVGSAACGPELPERYRTGKECSLTFSMEINEKSTVG